MSRKNATPASVRVARYTAVVAAITALGTIGNTFIEKRPWFLGGDDAKPEIVTSTPVKKVAMQHFESVEPVHFNVPNVSDELVEYTRMESFAEMKAVQDIEIVKLSAPRAAMMSAPPDMSWYDMILEFIEYKPISFWIIFLSGGLISVYSLLEYLNYRKKKNTVFFDTPPHE